MTLLTENTLNDDSASKENQNTLMSDSHDKKGDKGTISSGSSHKNHTKPLNPPLSDFKDPVVEANGIISFVMFTRKYHVKTDDPDLIFSLVKMIQGYISEVRSEHNNVTLFDLDILIQAIFRMALKLHNALGDEESSKENIEIADKKIQNLLDFLNRNL